MEREYAESLDVCRGILNGLMFCVPFWGAVLAVLSLTLTTI